MNSTNSTPYSESDTMVSGYGRHITDNDSSASSDEWVIAWLDISLGLLSAVFLLLGIVGNSLALLHFVHCVSDRVANMIYVFITVTDILTCITSVPSTTSLITNRQTVLAQSSFVCTSCGFVFNITSRFSVFLIAFLSVARSLVLINPFTRFSRCSILGLILSYLALLIVQMTLPLALGAGYSYQSFWTFCSWKLDQIVNTESVWYTILFYLFFLCL